MKTLYLDCGMGAAGDMLTAALLELLPDPDGFVDELNALGIPGVQYRREMSVKCGITGTHMSVTVNGVEESDHSHAHHHDHGDGHSHSSLAHITSIIDSLLVSDKVKEDAKAVYGLLAQAEATVHKTTINEIHFHEVGTLDAVADIVAGCMLMDTIKPDQVIASPVHVGNGQVRCAHGILPVPAPATALLLEKIPFYTGTIDGELCTPTGAALLSYFADSFGPMPVLTSSRTGYGLGSKDFSAANVLRAFLGEEFQSCAQGESHIAELRCTLDDMTPEAIGSVQELLLEQGALDVVIIPVLMKKNRPGQILCVSCQDNDIDKMTKLLFAQTTTAGVRKLVFDRSTLAYDFSTVSTPYGQIRIKHYFGYGTDKYKPEYEDVAKAAKKHHISFQTVWQEALKNL